MEHRSNLGDRRELDELADQRSQPPEIYKGSELRTA
jgi:hypothetical protein